LTFAIPAELEARGGPHRHLAAFLQSPQWRTGGCNAKTTTGTSSWCAEREAAEQARDEFIARGHHQHYWLVTLAGDQDREEI
jgi:hypothetical protein